MNAPAIAVRGVSKRFRLYRRRETTLKETLLRRRRGVYEEFLAADGLTFDVGRGEALGIIGRNGSGKSTLLKMLARILEPDEGTISIDGRVSALLELGAGFHPEYSAVENIFLSGAIYGLSRKQLTPRVEEIIRFAQLERFAENPVKTYSSGMYARLGFAIAVNVDPDVLLCDEVLAVGDESFRQRCYERMLEFRDAGKTLLLVTHDLAAVDQFCDRAIWLDAGRIRADGAPRDVARAYLREVNAEDELWSAQQAASRSAAIHVPLNASVPIVLRTIRLCAADGEERDVFHNGERLAVEIHYRAANPVRSPIFEIELHRHDGTHVTTTTNRLGGFDPGDVLAGEGHLDWAVEDLRLVPGSYYVTVRLRDESGIHVLDEHERWCRMQVREGAYEEREGCVILPAHWSHERTLEGEPRGARA